MSTIKKKSAARLSDAFVRSPDCATYLIDLKLPPELWAVFALTEQPVTAEQVVDRSGLDLETAKLALRRLARRKLIQKHVLGWQDYIKAGPVAAPAPAPVFAPAPAVVATAPVVAAAVVAPAPAIVASPAPVAPTPALVRLSATPKPPVVTEVVFTLRSAQADARRRAAAAGIIEFKLTRTAAPSATVAGRKLRPILDAIIEKGGGGLQGQLLAYRVFLRIPSEIAAAAGLSSLSLVDDDFIVEDPRLIDALFEAARTVAGLESLPQAA